MLAGLASSAARSIGLLLSCADVTMRVNLFMLLGHTATNVG